MSDIHAASDKGIKKKTSNGKTEPPNSPIESSPLSTPISDEEIDDIKVLHPDDGQHAERNDTEGAMDGGSTNFGSAYSQVADEGSETNDDEHSNLFTCPDCYKTYSTPQSLKRHINDTKTKCYKARGAAEDVTRWSCPRCHAHMSKKYSAIRHIRDSCWKICDECCGDDSAECDGLTKDGPCTACEQAGKSCTKHTKPLPGCAPVILTAALAVPSKAIDRTKPAAAPRQRRQKRKAMRSPESSPDSKPTMKRETRHMKKQGQAVFDSVPSKQDEIQPGHTDDTGEQLSKDTHDEYIPPLPLHHRGDVLVGDVPQRSSYARPPAGLEALRSDNHTVGPGSQASQMLPPLLGNPPLGMSQSAQYSQQSSHDMIRRQLQAVQSMNLRSLYTPGYGSGTYPISVNSDLRTSPNLGQDGWAPQSSAHPGAHGPSGNYENHHQNHGLSPFTSSGSGLYYAEGPAMTEDHLRLSAPTSIISSRRPSFDIGGLPAPGSRVPSRQPSRQSSAENLRLSLNSNLSNDNEVRRNDEDADRLMVKFPIPRELKNKFSFKPVPQISHPDNPVIRLRIHSNTYDDNGMAIFSILTMRIHDTFGPRLEYYCTQRGKLYGLDWRFIFKYPAPLPERPNRQKYFDLLYNMKPAGCCDAQYPGCAMRDGDTILVVVKRASSSLRLKDPEAAAAVQMECQRIDIQNGETKVWQAPDVNLEWYRDADKEIVTLRNALGLQHGELFKMRNVHLHGESIIAGLQAQNAQLQEELQMLRSARVPFATQQNGTGAFEVYQGLMRHGPFRPAVSQFRNPAVHNRTQPGFPPPVATNFAQMQGLPAAHRQGLVHSATDQVAAEKME